MSVKYGLTPEEDREVDAVMNLPDEIYARDSRIRQLERLNATLAARIDELDQENTRLKQHVRNLAQEEIPA